MCMVALRAVLRILPHTETGGDGRTGRLKVVTPALGNPWAPRKDLDGNALSGIGGRLCPCALGGARLAPGVSSRVVVAVGGCARYVGPTGSRGGQGVGGGEGWIGSGGLFEPVPFSRGQPTFPFPFPPPP